MRSALLTRLERHLDLTPSERHALDWADRRDQRFSAGERLMEVGQPNRSLFMIQFGWLHSSTYLKAGTRQILGFHYPGDLVGTSGIAWSCPATTLTAVSDCVVSEMSKDRLGAIFSDYPRLAALFYAIAAAETVAMSDRLTSIGRMSAIDRLATLLLDMLARLRVTAGGVIHSFDLPLTQQDLGDAVGLTKVHVSRTLAAMEKQRMIERHGRRVTILDEAALAASVGFVDRYATIDTVWLPPVEAAA